MSDPTQNENDRRQPVQIGVLTPDGLEPAPYTAYSLAEAAQYEPEGIYTVARTFHRIQVLLFGEHMARMARSAALTGMTFGVGESALRHALRTLIDQAGYRESRFRITIPHAQPDRACLSLEPFDPPAPAIYENGVRVATTHLARPNPGAKYTGWMALRKGAVQALPPGAYEAILIDPAGNLLEGTSSNFYAVMDGALHTAGEGVLPGMAQKIVLTVAPEVLPVEMTPVRADRLWALDEAFLTSASRGIVPVVMIDTQIVGTGRPGPLTLKLRAAYEAWAEGHLETLE